MFRKLLIALDESSCSEHAGRLGLALAKRLSAEATVVHVITPAPAPFGIGTYSQTLERYAQELLSSWKELGKDLGLEVKIRYTHAQDAAEGIVHTATELACDLIVMGTHGRERLSRVFLGSVAERVSRLSPVAVLLVREDSEVRPISGVFERILAPVDGSMAGAPALQVADQLAQKLGAKLQILHVIPYLPPLIFMPGTPNTGPRVVYNPEATERALLEEGQAIVEAAKSKAKTSKVHTEVVKAQADLESQVIVEYAQQHHSDLIVMGTHGRTGIERLLLGSVAEGVAHHASVPLLLLRPNLTPKSA